MAGDDLGQGDGAGKVLGVVPKSFLPNYREFYERRWFTPGAGVAGKSLRNPSAW